MMIQFFLRTTDEEVEKYLKIFTFIRVVELKGIMEDHKVRLHHVQLVRPFQTTGLRVSLAPKAQPSSRIAQKVLASEATELIHGCEYLYLSLSPSQGRS